MRIGQFKRSDIPESQESVDNYFTILEDKEIIKFGIITSPQWQDLPIYLNVNGDGYEEFKLNNNGILEIQPETFSTLNEETFNINIKIKGVKVPDKAYQNDSPENGDELKTHTLDFDFIIDYITES